MKDTPLFCPFDPWSVSKWQLHGNQNKANTQKNIFTSSSSHETCFGFQNFCSKITKQQQLCILYFLNVIFFWTTGSSSQAQLCFINKIFHEWKPWQLYLITRMASVFFASLKISADNYNSQSKPSMQSISQSNTFNEKIVWLINNS